MPESLHSMLVRQLKRFRKGPEDLPADWMPFLQAVDNAYREFDKDRNLLERSLELSSEELVQTNTDLRASEMRYRTFIDASTDLVFLKDESFRYLISNRANNAFLGRPEADVIGRTDFDLMPQENAARCRDSDQEVLRQGTGLSTEEAVGGKIYQTLKFPVPLPGGRTGVGGYVRDVTRRKQIEQALKESHALFSLFMHHSPIYTFIKEVSATESRVLMASDNFKDMVGIPGSEMRGKTMEELFPPEFAAKISADDWAVVSKGEVLKQDEELDGHYYVTIKFPIVRQGTTLLAGYTIDISDRRQAEEALRRSEEKFEKAFQTSPYAILITRAADGRFIDVNDAFTSITGFSRQEALANTTLGLGLWLREEDRQQVVGTLNEGRPVAGMELRFRARNGRILTGLFSAQLIQLGSETCILSSLGDITERKQAEEKLRASTEQFRDVASNIPGVIYQLRTGRTGSLEVPYMSSGCEALFERPVANLDFAGLLFNHMHFGDRALFEHSIDAAANQMERWSLEFRIATPDGKTKWLRGSANPRRLPDGRILWNGVLLDISEQKRAEESRRESEERFRLLVKNSSDIIAVIDVDGIVKYVSPAEESVSGFSSAELTGKSIGEIIHPEDMERTLLAFRETIAHPEKTHRVQCRHIHKTRGWVPVEIVGQSFLAEPAVKGVIVSVRDVTERRQTEEEMARQMDELRRWHSVTLGREDRIAELKREVNALAIRLGQPPPYVAVENTGDREKA